MPTLEIKPTQPWLIAQPGNVAEITGQFGGADQLRNTVLYRQTTLTKHLRRTRDLLFHDTVAPHLAAYAPEASAAQQRDFLIHLPRR